MPEAKRSPLFRYGLTLVSVAMAAAFTWLLNFRERPFALFFAAVMVSSLYGGRIAGFLAIALSALLNAYLFLSPHYSFAIGLEGLIQLGLFFFVSILISSLTMKAQRAEAQTRSSEDRLRTTLRSIGDAVIATDEKGRVNFMNPVAQTLTGWEMKDARGRELAEVFHIINESTRQPVESPVTKVLNEGKVVGLANHTLLVARNGQEIPIDDSGAPIMDEEGNITGVVLVFHDVRERRDAEQAVRRLAAIVESSSDAIFSKTLDGIITSWNSGAQRLYGYTPDEVLGHNVSLLVPPDRPNEVPGILERLKAGERTESLETIRQKKNGEQIYVSLTVSPIKNERGEIIGASTIARDITERRRMEVELESLLEREHNARLEAEEANRLKDEFLATLSHELRTPLTAMLGWTRMLRTRQLDDNTSTHALETIERNVRSQTQLIEDLLDVSRIITGNLRMDARPVELVPVIEAAIDAIQPAAEAKAIRLERALDPAASPVLGDAARLQQVVWNLISNAVKFTPRGGHVHISLRRDETTAILTVEDTGIGIREDFLPYVFERFRQADSSSTRAYGGLGLGLAIVRHLVELHGGTVSAASEGPERGASFTVQLPLMVVAALRPSDNDEARDGDGAGVHADLIECGQLIEGSRILVVDDEEDTRNLIATILTQCKARVETVSDASEAIAAIKRECPDILISDIGMPEKDGYCLVGELRASTDAQLKELPAIALTAYAGEDDRQRSLAAGFQIHLAKPVDPEALLAAIEQLLKQDQPSAHLIKEQSQA